jgi:hypothetical protein
MANDTSAPPPDKPMIIIQDIDSAGGKRIAQSLIANDTATIIGLTTIFPPSPESSTPRIPTIYTDITSILTLRSLLRTASTIYLHINPARYVQEHSTISLASVWRKTAVEVAERRQWEDCRSIMDAMGSAKGLKSVVLFGKERGKIEKALRKYIGIYFPSLAISTASVAEAEEGEEDMGGMFDSVERFDDCGFGWDGEEEDGEGMRYLGEESDSEFEFSTQVYKSGRGCDEEECERLSEEMVKKGFRNPTVWNTGEGVRSVNGRKRNDFVSF